MRKIATVSVVSLVGRWNMNVLGSALFLIVGLYILSIGLFSLRKVRASRRWPFVVATIRAAKVIQHADEPGGFKNPMMAKPLITYAYHVDDKRYIGEGVTRSDQGWIMSNEAKEISSRYPVGRVVQAYYNPRDPSESCLEHMLHIKQWLSIPTGVLLSGGGLIGLWINLC